MGILKKPVILFWVYKFLKDENNDWLMGFSKNNAKKSCPLVKEKLS